ncbi:MAG: hypothetical protein BroJett011_33830 [Chloroflexota bacterium]|nr:MAG: hypothetical protein BroJett011_33830 [Chloroflexota bacterium]
MTQQHTPGPWTYHFEEPNRDWVLIMAGGPKGKIIANVNTQSCPDIDSAPLFRVMPAKANANLIAAAPDMYEALEMIHEAFIKGEIRFTKQRRSDLDPYHPANTKMSVALAKARGEPQ